MNRLSAEEVWELADCSLWREMPEQQRPPITPDFAGLIDANEALLVPKVGPWVIAWPDGSRGMATFSFNDNDPNYVRRRVQEVYAIARAVLERDRPAAAGQTYH